MRSLKNCHDAHKYARKHTGLHRISWVPERHEISKHFINIRLQFEAKPKWKVQGGGRSNLRGMLRVRGEVKPMWDVQGDGRLTLCRMQAFSEKGVGAS